MRIAFYYQNWDVSEINGTQDAVGLLMRTLGDMYGHDCYSFKQSVCDEKSLSKYDVVVFLSSVKPLNVGKINTTKVLWNHCWDYVEGTSDIRDAFDLVMGLSPKHAAHLGVEDWCYNGIDTKVFYRQGIPKQKNKVVYCGGPAWWKGGKKIPKIKEELNNAGYDLEEVWGASHAELAVKFNQAQFVIIPSEIESFCLVSVQAQACGCIPIAHDVGGISETLFGNKMGLCTLLYEDDVVGVLKQFENDKYNYISSVEDLCIENSKRFDIKVVASKFNLMMSYV